VSDADDQKEKERLALVAGAVAQRELEKARADLCAFQDRYETAYAAALEARTAATVAGDAALADKYAAEIVQLNDDLAVEEAMVRLWEKFSRDLLDEALWDEQIASLRKRGLMPPGDDDEGPLH